MVKTAARLDHVIGERSFVLICDFDAPTRDVKEALNEFMAQVMQVEKMHLQNQKQKEEAEVVVQEE